MSLFENTNDNTTLTVEHDAHGCTILGVNANDDKTNPIVYGIPGDQLPAVLLEMAGGEYTQEEHEAALDLLNDPRLQPSSVEDLIVAARKTLLALHIRTQVEAVNVAAAEADAPNYALADEDAADPLDDMSRDELLAEAKASRADARQLLREQEEIRQAMHGLQQRFQAVNQVLVSIHQGITAVVAENNPGAADA